MWALGYKPVSLLTAQIQTPRCLGESQYPGIGLYRLFDQTNHSNSQYYFSLRQIARSSMKTESVVQNIPFVGRKRSLIEDARKERASGSSSPGPSRGGENFVFEEKEGTVTLNIIFALSHEKNAGFFKTGKVFEVRKACSSLEMSCRWRASIDQVYGIDSMW